MPLWFEARKPAQRPPTPRPTDAPRTGCDKTSICFDFSEDAAGTLHGALGELASRDINMIKIESRPDRRSLGRYIFLIDIEGHREDRIVREALDGIRARATMFKVLGSYPRAMRSVPWSDAKHISTVGRVTDS